MATFERSDGWIHMSINKKEILESIIGIGDAYNHSVFNYDELDEGLNRLIANGLIKKVETFYIKTEDSTLYSKVKKFNGGPRHILFKCMDVFGKLEMVVTPNLKNHIITEHDYESSLKLYIGQS